MTMITTRCRLLLNRFMKTPPQILSIFQTSKGEKYLSNSLQHYAQTSIVPTLAAVSGSLALMTDYQPGLPMRRTIQSANVLVSGG